MSFEVAPECRTVGSVFFHPKGSEKKKSMICREHPDLSISWPCELAQVSWPAPQREAVFDSVNSKPIHPKNVADLPEQVRPS